MLIITTETSDKDIHARLTATIAERETVFRRFLKLAEDEKYYRSVLEGRGYWLSSDGALFKSKPEAEVGLNGQYLRSFGTAVK
jgi:hypothetical protein